MKILLFTLLYSFAGALFANSYAESNSTTIATEDAFFISDALLVEGDSTGADDLDTVGYVDLKSHLAPIYVIKSPTLFSPINTRPSHYYHTRAPPLIA
ncbi:hypothetical protein OLEAN_C15140 [Oleispira antarctica RB-8]|uniref:Uncharacterized protein n=1 Tax=Oleispira antarctica RB-8 TaxID=698738 RepID=R4YM11_OLEAN|nr:hypothetical protein OLEAN_C15140 [Oleispira antarctica RB-8]|tara:strand:- start:691 stop:984 length:294 start_codon:yes stop_codon:yes gene_type:complete